MAIIDISNRYDIPFKWPRLVFDLGKIDNIAIHHSVTPTPSASMSQADEIKILDAIDRYHRSIGFGGFAYHGAAFPSGRSYKTTRWSQWGAHVGGNNNHLAGLVAIGTYTTTLAPKPVLEGFAELVDAWDKLLKRKVPLRSHGKNYGGWTYTACPGLINKQVSSIRGLIVKEDDIVLLRARETGAVYAVGAGKRHIGGAEYKAWVAMGFRYTNVAKVDLAKIPTINALVQRTPFKPAGHPGAVLKTWISSYDGHRKTDDGRQNHTVVKEHMDDRVGHSLKVIARPKGTPNAGQLELLIGSFRIHLTNLHTWNLMRGQLNMAVGVERIPLDDPIWKLPFVSAKSMAAMLDGIGSDGGSGLTEEEVRAVATEVAIDEDTKLKVAK